MTSPCLDLALLPERDHAREMITKRHDEFLTGRTCAREALRKLGFPDQPLLPGSNRAPEWPLGALGSISHTEGFYAAAVGRAGDFFGIGIDVEQGERVTEKLERRIATPAESERDWGHHDWRTLLFSAKESIFKAINPATGVRLGFHDVELLTFADGHFEARVSPEKLPSFQISGKYALVPEFVLSAVVLGHDTPMREILSRQS